MATRYVTKHGSASDSNGGTNATTDAWATAIKGFSSISGGDTLVFGTGTYDVARPTNLSPIPNGTGVSTPTIITDNGDGVVTFQHPGTASRFGIFNFSSGAHFYISFIGTAQDQIVIDGESQDIGSLVYLASGTTFDNHHFHFKNVEFKRCRESMVLGGRSPDNTFDNCTIHDNIGGNNPSQTTPQDHGFYMSGNNLVIKNCRFYNIFGNAIQMFSTQDNSFMTGRQLINNTIWNGGYGLGTQNGKGIVFEEGGGIIHNNLVYDYAGDGIAVWRGKDVSIYHNTVHNCGIEGGYGIQVGFSGTNALRCLVKNNIAIDNADGDMRVTTATDTVVSWNIFGSASIINSGTNTTNSNNNFSEVDTDVWVDPINVTLTSRDYNLKAGSSAIWDASTNNVPSVGVTTDIEGTSRVHPDQGAYAFGTPDPPDPPVIGHNTTYAVTPWTLVDIALTLFDNDSNTLELTVTATGNTSVEFGDTTNVTVT